MKLYNYILITIIFFSSCSSNIVPYGKYASTKNPNSIQINKDGTFFYQYRGNHLFAYSKGLWGRSEARLINLNSEIKKAELVMTVQESVNKGEQRILDISIKTPAGKKIENYECAIYINDSLYAIKNINSIQSIMVNESIKDIYFAFVKSPKTIDATAAHLPLLTNRYFPKSHERANLKVSIILDENLLFYKVFNNEKIKIGHNWIKIYNTQNKLWEKLPKVGMETNIFSKFKGPDS